MSLAMTTYLGGQTPNRTRTGLAVRVGNFMRWTRFEKLCFPTAWLLLGLSRLAVFSVPFRYLAPWLGTQSGPSPWIPLTSSSGEASAASIGRVVRRAASCTPWRSNCLAQAVTARILLGVCGVPYSLFFGVAGDAGEADSGQLKVSAHAWVSVGRVAVTGGAGFERFTVLNCFVAAKPASGLLHRR